MKKEHVKLITDTSALSTRTKLCKEQIIELEDNSKSQFELINKRITNIKAEIKNATNSKDTQEIAAKGAVNQRLLKEINKGLKTRINNPAIQQREQIKNIKENLENKILNNPIIPSVEKALKKANQTTQYINESEQILQNIFENAIRIQNEVQECMQSNDTLIFDQTLQNTAQKTTRLANELANINFCLLRSPDLKKTHSKQFLPLKEAMDSLISQTSMLKLAEQDLVIEKTSSKPAQNMRNALDV